MKISCLFLSLFAFIFSIHFNNEEDLSDYIDLTKEPQFSSVGWVYTKDGSCTGTLIAPRVVITSASALKETDLPLFNIYIFGRYFSVQGKVFFHPNYRFSDKSKEPTPQDISSDIAVIILSMPLHGVNYLKLPNKALSPLTKMHFCSFAKWSYQSSDFLRNCKLSCNIFIDSVTNFLLRAPFANDINLDLFGHPNSDNEFGAPLIAIDDPSILQGIFKTNYKKEKKQYSLFIDLFSHVDWINKTLEEELKKD